MALIPPVYGLVLATVLFALGLLGVLVRRNLIFVLISIEVMLNAAGLAFLSAGARWEKADGQVMFIFILAMAAVEVSIGLALALKIRRQFGTLDIDAVSKLKDRP